MAFAPPTPPSAAPTPSLSAEINAATRKQHVALNRLIMARLPLALPPMTHNLDLLYFGLTVFSRIYFTYESVWERLNGRPEDRERADTGHDERMWQWLASLRPSGLARTARLEDDLRHLSQHIHDSSAAAFVVPKLTVLQQPLLQRLRAVLEAKPHCLVACAWVMYMAIFSGGRWIRAKLAGAGTEFWTRETTAEERVDLRGFSFLSFASDRDGEDIKAEFKLRLVEAEDIFSPQERVEVVEVASQLFDDCIAMVEMLDSMVKEALE